MTELERKLLNGEFIGIVEDNVDPDKKQRVRIRIPYLHGTINEIPTDALPWAQPKRDSNGLSWQVPELNKIVNVTFPNGNLYYPVYVNAQHLNVNLQKKIETYDGDDYTAFMSLIYNYNSQIYIDANSMNVMYNQSGMIVDKDANIIQRLSDKNSKFMVGDDQASEQMMLGTEFIKWLDRLVDSLMTAPYIGNSGAPVVTNGPLLNVLNEYKMIKKNFLSNNAYINKNDSIVTNENKNEVQIGDKFDLTTPEEVAASNQIQTKITELETKKIQEKLNNEAAKKQKADEILDEKINESESKTETEIQEEIKKVETIDTTKIEEKQEVSSESQTTQTGGTSTSTAATNNSTTNSDAATEEEIVVDDTGESESEDVYTDDYSVFQEDEDDYDYIKSVPPSVLQNNPNTAGTPAAGGVSGRRSSYDPVNYKREPLDFSGLKKNDKGEYMVSSVLRLKDVINSPSARRINNDNMPDNNQHLANLQRVSEYYFDGTFKYFKEKHGLILVLNSAYRNLAVNTAVGGAKNSQHKSGSALDLKLVDSKGNRYNNLLFYYLKHKMNNFGQLIWEGNYGDGPQWCHISLNNQGTTGSIFTAEGGVFKKPNADTLKKLKDTGIWNDAKEKG